VYTDLQHAHPGMGVIRVLVIGDYKEDIQTECPTSCKPDAYVITGTMQ